MEVPNPSFMAFSLLMSNVNLIVEFDLGDTVYCRARDNRVNNLAGALGSI